MNVRVRSVVGSALLAFGLAALAGCGRSSPAAPTAAPTTAAVTSASQNRTVSQVTVRPAGGSLVTTSLQGTFAIANGSGDSLTGTYSGTAVSAGGTEQALLTLQITGGTGVYLRASGTADAVGSGGYSGEGAFSLDGRGDAVLQGGKHAQITMNLSGTSVASCSATSQFIITQTGSGTMGRAGRVTATFQHQVTGGAGCGS